MSCDDDKEVTSDVVLYPQTRNEVKSVSRPVFVVRVVGASCHVPLAPPNAIPTFGLGSGVSGLSCSEEQDKRHKAEKKNDKMRKFCMSFSLCFLT